MNAQVKTILITGCSSGIGYATAIALKKRNYRVLASARKTSDVQRLINEGFEAVLLDLADSYSIKRGFEQAVEIGGNRIDVLFNNAAFGQPGAVEDLTRKALRNQFETNVFGTQELTNLCIAQMRKQGHGRIIYNSSVLGFVALRYRGAYNASKYALEGLADTLRLELHSTKIKIVLLEPGPITSNFRSNAFACYKKFINKQTSVHQKAYQAMEVRLQKTEAVAPFTLSASAVADKVIVAIESRQPRIRYYVTFPTYLFAYLKKILPMRVMDALLRLI